MDNVELDFQILDPADDGLQMSVLLVAAKRELVETKIALLTDIGIDPSVIDVDAFALHNAFEVNYPDAMKGVVGLVNIGHEITNVNILDEGVPVLTRDLPVGTRRFREDLQRERGLSADEARAAAPGLRGGRHADAVSAEPGRGAGGGHRARGGVPPDRGPLGRRPGAALPVGRRGPDSRAGQGPGRPAQDPGPAGQSRSSGSRWPTGCSIP